MKQWLGGLRGGLLKFAVITGLVAGGLGWATAAALRLEREQLADRAAAERTNKLNVAMWRLESQVTPFLAREHSRPFDHYSAVYAPPVTLNNAGTCLPPGAIVEPSPLLNAELPAWMLLHFQLTASRWESPQVPAASLSKRLSHPRIRAAMTNVTPERRHVLESLACRLPPSEMLAIARERTEPATLHDVTLLLANRNPANAPSGQKLLEQGQAFLPQGQEANLAGSNLATQMPQAANPSANEYGKRSAYQNRINEENAKVAQRVTRDQAENNSVFNGENWFQPREAKVEAGKNGPQGKSQPGTEATVALSKMVPLWVRAGQADELLLLRLVNVEGREICQGIVLDAPALCDLLTETVTDLFPSAQLLPVREVVADQLEQTMTALPFRLDPGPPEPVAEPGWSPLRVGLAMAWSAAGIALIAVALGGWSLLDLSERRIRFVSAVTHELRTPLTTLRLYLDMLLGGLVRDETQRLEYLQTLNAETDRLNRLVGNVLDFSRLEKHQPQVILASVGVAGLLTQVHDTWLGRCREAGKELIVENSLAADAVLCTDAGLLLQILGNLLENACKYSRGSDDPRVWVRVRPDKGQIQIDVEDRGPGVPAADRGLIFRAFRRGRGTEVAVAGGVGLGLALAHRWAHLLGGRLLLCPPEPQGGACFRVELPA
jgi:signal transduction histidine kinase